jgi:hypothetical protein
MYRAVGTVGEGGIGKEPPFFARSDNPIQNREKIMPPGYSDLPTALKCTLGIKSTALFHNIQINQEEPCDRHVRVLLDASS